MDRGAAAAAGRRVHSLLDRVERAARGPRDIPYLVIEDALPRDYYEALAATFPTAEAVAGRGVLANNKAYRRPAVAAIGDPRVPEIWRDFLAHHCSRGFFDEVRRAFAAEIVRWHPRLEEGFGKPLERFTVGMRRPGDAGNPANRAFDIALDALFVINSPVTRAGTVRGPHLDGRLKLFAGLFYMRRPEDASTGGDLRFYRLRRHGRRLPSPALIHPSQVEPAATVPYRANTLVLFLNTADSIHGVTPRSRTASERRYVNLLGECYGGRSPGFYASADPLGRLWQAAKGLLTAGP